MCCCISSCTNLSATIIYYIVFNLCKYLFFYLIFPFQQFSTFLILQFQEFWFIFCYYLRLKSSVTGISVQSKYCCSFKENVFTKQFYFLLNKKLIVVLVETFTTILIYREEFVNFEFYLECSFDYGKVEDFLIT